MAAPADSLDQITGPDSQAFAIEDFLATEQEKDLLRFTTAGSVDDGKSTLIGRLLYDSRNVYEDHVRAVTHTQGGSGQAFIDFAQLTDGLRAEREQGITIDVAYRYFSTAQRKFIIADTPGHEQYTRNMATGASTADLAIILLDVRKGVLAQSRRHAYIATLLGIRHLVAAINKMDLVDFSEDVYRQIEQDFRELIRQLGSAVEVQAIPVSALLGDNVVEPSANTPWYEGPTLLEHLETIPALRTEGTTGFRMPVQRVIRPDQHYRGFAGQVATGSIHPGDRVLALPSGRSSRVATITTFNGDLEVANAPQSIALTLDDELDISRGDWLVAVDNPPQSASRVKASLVWFDPDPLQAQRTYLLRHATETVKGRVTRVRHRIDVQTLGHESARSLKMNDIGEVEIETVRPILFDTYAQARATGNFILIDPDTDATVAAGIIQDAVDEARETRRKPIVLTVNNGDAAGALEDALLQKQEFVVRTRVEDQQLWRALLAAGTSVIVETGKDKGRGLQIVLASENDDSGEFQLELLSETVEGALKALAAWHKED